MRVRILQHRVQALQRVAHRGRPVAVVQVVEHGLVVFIHQHHHRLAVVRLGLPQQRGKAAGQGLHPLQRPQAEPLAVLVEHLADALLQLGAVAHAAPAEAETDHRMVPRPVPARLGRQTGEQRPVALEQLLEGIHQQALAETPRPAEKAGLA